MISVNLTEVENFLSYTIPKAGGIARKYFRSENLHFRKKSHEEIVTDADLEINDYLIRTLLSEYPDFPILSEESKRLPKDKYLESEAYWIIDPIDGTHNFARGSDQFAISIALCQEDKTILGSVYAPIEQKWYQARSDKEGSLCNGSEIHAGSKNALQNMKVFVTFGYDYSSREAASVFIQKMIKHTSNIYSLGSAVLSECEVARGLGDVYRGVGIKPWDQAAAAFIAQKAGAIVLDGDGNEWTIFSESILMGKEGIVNKLKKELVFY